MVSPRQLGCALVAVVSASLALVPNGAGAMRIQMVEVEPSASERDAMGPLYGRPTSFSVFHPSEAQPTSAVMLLHGRCGSAQEIEASIPISRMVDEYNTTVFIPEATRNDQFCPSCGGPVWGGYYGCRAWAATPQCCTTGRSRVVSMNDTGAEVAGAMDDDTFAAAEMSWSTWNPVDDSTYLMRAVDAVLEQFPSIDASRVFVAGKSSGGFMAYRMACDHPERFAAAASIGGAMFNDVSLCRAFNTAPEDAEPVHILQVHGSEDIVVPFNGGAAFVNGPEHVVPGAVESTMMWAQHNGCEISIKEVKEQHDFLGERGFGAQPQNDTGTIRYANGCRAGGSAELWIIPAMKDEFPTNMKVLSLSRALMHYFETHRGGQAAPSEVADTSAQDDDKARVEADDTASAEAADAMTSTAANDADAAAGKGSLNDEEYVYEEMPVDEDYDIPMAEAFAGPSELGVNDMACASGVRKCPDGSTVTRVPPKCRFTKCGQSAAVDGGNPVDGGDGLFIFNDGPAAGDTTQSGPSMPRAMGPGADEALRADTVADDGQIENDGRAVVPAADSDSENDGATVPAADGESEPAAGEEGNDEAAEPTEINPHSVDPEGAVHVEHDGTQSESENKTKTSAAAYGYMSLGMTIIAMLFVYV